MSKSYQDTIRKYRFLNQEMTQERLGKELGVSRQTMSRIENGRQGPSLEQAYKMSKILNTTMEELFFGDTRPGSSGLD
jgi:putative transcriptional regulator